MATIMSVCIKYSDPNSQQVIGLTEAFQAAGKYKISIKAKSFIDYDVGGAVDMANPVSENDIQRLESLGAKVTVTQI